jgi:hypothetical protein
VHEQSFLHSLLGMASPPGGRRRIRGKTTPLCQVDGASSGDDDEAEAVPTARGQCGQFVWPCPRQYPEQLQARQQKKWLIPADLSKWELGLMFKNVLLDFGHGPSIMKVHVFDEPHKRYSRATAARERHKHVIFKMKATFAHLQIQKALAAKGVYGHFSFNLVGYVKYLQYCLVPSAKKLQADIDRNPWSWPHAEPSELVALCDKMSAQMGARNGLPGCGRKRKLMTFSEITDAFVEGGVRTEKAAWVLAKFRKTGGDETLFNTLGASQSVHGLVIKVRQAWDCEAMTSGTLCTQADFSLDTFVSLESVHPGLVAWAQGGWKHTSLILCGAGGLGKTEFACALIHKVSFAGAYHFINKQDRLRDVVFCPGEGLMVDEACMAGNSIDDVKSILDLAKGRDVECRNRDGFIPKHTPRIFSTNWPWDLFWPRAAWDMAHATAITRRILWVDIRSDLRATTFV